MGRRKEVSNEPGDLPDIHQARLSGKKSSSNNMLITSAYVGDELLSVELVPAPVYLLLAVSVSLINPIVLRYL